MFNFIPTTVSQCPFPFVYTLPQTAQGSFVFLDTLELSILFSKFF